MFTLGFRFKPWTSEKAIADGPSIMSYLKETVAEYGIDKHIRYGQNVVAADWSDADNRWTVHRRARRRRSRDLLLRSCSRAAATTTTTRATRRSSPAPTTSTARSSTRSTGRRISTTQGKNIVVIGSGATAVTLIPALDRFGRRSRHDAAALTDVHRLAAGVDPFTVRMNKALPAKPAYVVNRWKSIMFQSAQYQHRAGASRSSCARPLMTMAERRLPEGYDVDKHFGPELQPVGSATVPGAQRRSVQDDPRGQGRRRHRHHRAVHQDRDQAGLGRRASKPTSSSPQRV